MSNHLSNSVIVATPVDHIDGLTELLSKDGRAVFLGNPSRQDFIEALHKIRPRAIFVNPNAQQFVIDEEIVRGSVEVVCTASTGTDHIDLDSCERNDVRVLSLINNPVLEQLPGTAELALTLTLALIRQIGPGCRDVQEGNWDYRSFMGHELKSLTVGVLGLGRLGRMYSRMCHPLFGRVLAHDPYLSESPENVELVSLDQLMRESDVLSIHVHHSKLTHHMFDSGLISSMGLRPFVINTSRGGIVDENAIANAVISGGLRGYATDVLEDEYRGEDRSNHSLVRAMSCMGKNVIITPHVGGMTEEGQKRAWEVSVSMLWKELES